MLAGGLLRTGFLVEHHHEENRHRASLYRKVAEMGLERAAVVVRAPSPTLLARNLTDWEAPVIYLAPRGKSDEELADLFADRQVYVAEPANGDAWAVRRVR
jgi:hypothetical protein